MIKKSRLKYSNFKGDVMETKVNLVKEALSYFEVTDGELVKLADFNRVLRSVMHTKGLKYKVSDLDIYLPLINPSIAIVVKYITGKCKRYVSNLRFKGIG